MTLRSKLARLKSAGPGSQAGAEVGHDAAREMDGVAPDALDAVDPARAAAEPRAPDSELRQELRARVEAIRKRLEAMQVRGQRPAARTGSNAIAAASRAEPDAQADDDRLVAPIHVEVDGSELAGALLGETVQTPLGRMHRVRKRLRPSHVQGSTPIALALSASSRDFARIALDPTLEAVDLSRALYFDTETTGLAGGTGTLPFLLGLAWFEERALVVEQLVLRRPGEEGPILERLRERIQSASCVVSYNGKSFDWPLLRTRYVMNRIPAPKLPPHLDLLHCARRVFKARLSEVSLTAVEEAVLGLGRVDDIGGGRIPETYVQFLQGAPGAVLNPVIEHNAHDLISLAALLGDLALRYRGDPSVECHTDQLGLARTALRAGDLESARALAERATAAGGEIARRAHHLAAAVAKRERRFGDAKLQLLRALDHPGAEPTEAQLALELAKLLEHKLRDLPGALAQARRAAAAEDAAAHQKRIARLERRVGRRSEPQDDHVFFVHPALLPVGQRDADPLGGPLAPA